MSGIESRDRTQRGNNGNQLELGKDYNSEDSWKQEASFLDETGLNKDIREQAGLHDGEGVADFMEDLAGDDGIVGKGDLAQFESDGKMDPKKIQDFLSMKRAGKADGGRPDAPA